MAEIAELSRRPRSSLIIGNRSKTIGPLLTSDIQRAFNAALRAGESSVQCSLDLGRSISSVALDAAGWTWCGRRYPYLRKCRDRTIYHWLEELQDFEPVAHFGSALIKLVPTHWGPPTFEIDGIKMLPTAQISPYADAERKVGLVEPHGKRILDTCGGLGYFAACAVAAGATQVTSYEKNPDVIWLRGLNPWSPTISEKLSLTRGDISSEIASLRDGSFDAILHDPPRFGIAGELYALSFYQQLARVLRRDGKLFHYTGTPNKLTSGRDVPNEVSKRLSEAGFQAKVHGDGVLAVRR